MTTCRTPHRCRAQRIRLATTAMPTETGRSHGRFRSDSRRTSSPLASVTSPPANQSTRMGKTAQRALRQDYSSRQSGLVERHQQVPLEHVSCAGERRADELWLLRYHRPYECKHYCYGCILGGQGAVTWRRITPLIIDRAAKPGREESHEHGFSIQASAVPNPSPSGVSTQLAGDSSQHPEKRGHPVTRDPGGSRRFLRRWLSRTQR